MGEAVAILRELRKLTGQGKLLFPSIRSAARCMSENTINAALRRLGFDKNEMTGHGFRSAASSILNESGLWNPDAIERQLAHVDNDSSASRLCPRRFLGRARPHDGMVGGPLRRNEAWRGCRSFAGVT